MAKQHGLGARGLSQLFGNTNLNSEQNSEKNFKTVVEAVKEKSDDSINTSTISESENEISSMTKSDVIVETPVENSIDLGSYDTSAEDNNKLNNENTGALLINISRIQPDRNQPRKDFDEVKLQELADSIKEYGVISPIVVKANGPFYDIVAGERRWRAARLAGLKEIPVVVKNVDERTSREMSIIENIQRDDLNPVEEALAYQSLIDDYGLTQEEVASRVSKNRSTITNSLRLLKLDDEILDMIKEGLITQGHARALLAIDDIELRKKIALRCAEKNLSVREIENLVKLDKISKEKKNNSNTEEANELKRLKIIYKDLETKIKSKLGTKVSIVPKDKDKGRVEIEYYSQDDLDRIYQILNSSRE